MNTAIQKDQEDEEEEDPVVSERKDGPSSFKSSDIRPESGGAVTVPKKKTPRQRLHEDSFVEGPFSTRHPPPMVLHYKPLLLLRRLPLQQLLFLQKRNRHPRVSCCSTRDRDRCEYSS